MWTAQYFPFVKPRTLLTSGGLGTMGYGFPAAMGAQAAFPNKLVIDISGDGSFQMNSQELATVVQYHLPVKSGHPEQRLSWNDQTMAGVLLREAVCFLFSGRVFSGLRQIGRGLRSNGLRANKPEEVLPVLKKAFSIPEPVIIDFEVDPEENVYPMVPAGEALNQMRLI